MQFQFRLRTLFLLFVVVWSSMAAFGVGGIFVTGLCITIGMLIRVDVARVRSCSPHERLPSIVELAVLILTLLFLIALLMPAVQSAVSSGRRAQCTNNLKQILLALHNYHAVHGQFPPAYVADADGKPMHSWRVLILPYLEEQALYQMYNFSEPWDGPNNRKLDRPMPTTFRCPSATGREPVTSYVAVTGPHTAWPDGKGTSYDDFRDGTSKTIMLIEVADSDIHWMEPRDLTLDEALSAYVDSWQAITNHHVRKGYFVHRLYAGNNVGFADGSVHSFPGRPKRENLKALLTIDGGEPIDIDDLDFEPPVTTIDWSHCVGLAVFVVSLILLLSRPLPKAWIEPAGAGERGSRGAGEDDMENDDHGQ